MPLAMHCDRSDCDTWSYAMADFIIVSYTIQDVRYYCCKWCLVVEESKDAEPTEVVE
jgi:hypothetical protein